MRGFGKTKCRWMTKAKDETSKAGSAALQVECLIITVCRLASRAADKESKTASRCRIRVVSPHSPPPTSPNPHPTPLGNGCWLQSALFIFKCEPFLFTRAPSCQRITHRAKSPTRNRPNNTYMSCGNVLTSLPVYSQGVLWRKKSSFFFFFFFSFFF